jgi:type I restriction enzyme M protein
MIDADIVEAVIGLPPGLFYGTGIPACILVINKKKPDSLRGKILLLMPMRNLGREGTESSPT